jgi:hypothetical protein
VILNLTPTTQVVAAILLPLSTTACGDATITATSTFPKQDATNSGATVRVVVVESTHGEQEIGRVGILSRRSESD